MSYLTSKLYVVHNDSHYRVRFAPTANVIAGSAWAEIMKVVGHHINILFIKFFKIIATLEDARHTRRIDFDNAR